MICTSVMPDPHEWTVAHRKTRPPEFKISNNDKTVELKDHTTWVAVLGKQPVGESTYSWNVKVDATKLKNASDVLSDTRLEFYVGVTDPSKFYETNLHDVYCNNPRALCACVEEFHGTFRISKYTDTAIICDTDDSSDDGGRIHPITLNDLETKGVVITVDVEHQRLSVFLEGRHDALTIRLPTNVKMNVGTWVPYLGIKHSGVAYTITTL